MGSLAQVPQGLAAGALPVFLICYAIPGILWGRVRPAWARGLDAARREREIARLRRNPLLVREFLRARPVVAPPLPVATVHMGPQSAPFTLTIVANPFCRPCAEVHAQAEQLVQRSNGLVRCATVLVAEGPGRPISERALELTLAGRET
jgi:hypothetical protein